MTETKTPPVRRFRWDRSSFLLGWSVRPFFWDGQTVSWHLGFLTVSWYEPRG